MGNSRHPRGKVSRFRMCETEQPAFLFCKAAKAVLHPSETQILRFSLCSPPCTCSDRNAWSSPTLNGAGQSVSHGRLLPFQHPFTQLSLIPTEREGWCA